MYQVTNTEGWIKNITTGEFISEASRHWPEYEAWLAAGNTPASMPRPYEPNTPAHHRAIRDAAWQWMASIVKDRGYDSIESCVSYYDSGVARYKAEARAMVAWRDAVNQALEALVLNPPPGVDTWEEVCPLLPQPEAFPWPAKVELPLEGTEPPIHIGA